MGHSFLRACLGSQFQPLFVTLSVFAMRLGALGGSVAEPFSYMSLTKGPSGFGTHYGLGLTNEWISDYILENLSQSSQTSPPLPSSSAQLKHKKEADAPPSLRHGMIGSLMAM